MAQWNPGDVVILRSGGPTMTVRLLKETEGTVYCEWFDDKGQAQGRAFMPEQLESVDDGPSVSSV